MKSFSRLCYGILKPVADCKPVLYWVLRAYVPGFTICVLSRLFGLRSILCIVCMPIVLKKLVMVVRTFILGWRYFYLGSQL